MASIKPYATASGKRWRVRFTTPEGKRTDKRGFTSKAAAESWWGQQVALMNTGGWVDPAFGHVPVGTVADAWVDSLRLKASTIHGRKKDIRLHIKPRWGSTPIGKLTAAGVAEWLDELDLAGGTKRNVRATLARIVEYAVARGMVQANVVKRVPVPQNAPPRHVFLTPEQVGILLGEVRKPRRAEFKLLVETGMRFGEMAGLHVGDVSLSRRRINVRRTASLVGNEMVVDTPKAGRGRPVAVSRSMAEELRPYVEGRDAGEVLFPTRHGGYQRRPGPNGWFAVAVARARAKEPAIPEMTLHSLRHVAAGLMVRSGANVKVVQRQLGHASAAMTLDIYAALFDGDLDAVADGVGDALWGGQDVGKGENEGDENAA